ncbi:MAG: NAD-dependent dihydropyrimidine dehydrogenase subunit PreA [Alphaproteobacteria bacterium]|nr:NAD-dependent dihydropyrimidine dehydrogenase subunit PreA [Alphaproteobacteria bacterium]
MTILKNSVLGIQFENPFLLASAPPTANIKSIDLAFEKGWGGAVLKTITPDNLEMIEASPTYATFKDGHKIYGFENIELLSHLTVKEWLAGIRFLKKKHPTKIIIASIMAPVQKEKWQKLVKTFNQSPCDAFELNFSCPHGMPEKGIGMAIGTDAEISAQITRWVTEVAKKPVFVKLSPNVTNIVEIAKAVEKAGADGIAAINTVQSMMGVDLDTFVPYPSVNGKSTFGGYSGRAIKPIGLRCVAQIRQASKLPILGSGGISTWQDAAEYIALGADVVQICTEVMINGYGIIDSLKTGLADYLKAKKLNGPKALKNKAIPQLSSHEKLSKKKKVHPTVDKALCCQCGKCVKICQESKQGCLTLVKGRIKLNKKCCVGCSLCSIVCPQKAIRMK